jgi:hypothetical protein
MKGRSSLEVKTGVKAGSVVIVEDIVLLNDAGLTVKTWVGIVRRWAKFDKICSLTQSGLVNMVVVRDGRIPSGILRMYS